MKTDPKLLAVICDRHDLPTPILEHRFHPSRKWKFDYAWPTFWIALEMEGGAYSGHGHRSVGKFLKDIEKYNMAAVMGWRVIRCTTDQMADGTAFEMVRRALYKQAE